MIWSYYRHKYKEWARQTYNGVVKFVVCLPDCSNIQSFVLGWSHLIFHSILLIFFHSIFRNYMQYFGFHFKFNPFLIFVQSFEFFIQSFEFLNSISYIFHSIFFVFFIQSFNFLFNLLRFFNSIFQFFHSIFLRWARPVVSGFWRGATKVCYTANREILLHKDGVTFCENFLRDLLTHVDLRGKTIQLLHSFGRR